jgi:cyclic pyranopterin phosphate synthase
MPAEGISKQSHAEIMRYEEIVTVVKAAVATGVEQIRITGGEPLVRSGIVDFVGEIASIKGLKDLSLTTNGALLGELAVALKKAGLQRVNISVDSLDRETFRQITRNGSLDEVIAGIDAAIAAGLTPIKINTVLIPGVNDHEILAFADFAVKKGISVRFIERMPFNDKTGRSDENTFISQEKVMQAIQSAYRLEPVVEHSFGPAKTFAVAGTDAKIGFISSRTEPFCTDCRRLRLTSAGILLPCLDSDNGKAVKGLEFAAIVDIIEKLYQEKKSWRKKHACYLKTFHNSLAKIGG